MNPYLYFEDILERMKRPGKDSLRVKKLDRSTSVERSNGQEVITVRYHGRVVLYVYKCGVIVRDGEYGYSPSLKKRLNEWLFGFHMSTEKFRPKVSWNGHTFDLTSECFLVTNRFGSNTEFFAENLRKSPRAYVERLVEYYNQPECGSLMVACDKVLTSA